MKKSKAGWKRRLVSGLAGIVAAASISSASAEAKDVRIDISEHPALKIGEWAKPAVLGVNVLAGGLEGGIGSALKSPARKWDWEAFGRGFLKFSFGGVVVYSGYEIAAAGPEYPLTGWLGAKVADVGHSMVHNALDGKGLFERIESYAGIFFISMDLSKKPRLRLALHPGSFLGLSYGLFSGYKLDVGHSLKYLTPIFKVDTQVFTTPLTRNVEGFTLGTIMFYMDGTNVDSVLSHENVHRAQIGRFNPFNDIYSLSDEPLVLWGDLAMMVSALKGYGLCQAFYKRCYAPYANMLEFEAYGLDH